MNLRISEKSDNQFIQNLWIKAFGDGLSGEYINFMFTKILANNYGYIAELHGDCVGFGFALPAKISGNKSLYLYSLAVENKHRNKGIMTDFLQQIEEIAFNNGYHSTCLIPEGEKLRQYYQKRGYKNISSLKTANFTGAKGSMAISNCDISEYLEHRNLFFKEEVLARLDEKFNLLAVEEALFFGYKIAKFPLGYCIYKADAKSVLVREILALEKDYQQIANALCSNANLPNCEMILPSFANLKGENSPLLMMKTNPSFQNNPIDYYCNLMLN